MKIQFIALFVLSIFIFNSCEKKDIDTSSNEGAKNLREAKERLTRAKKWKLIYTKVSNVEIHDNIQTVYGSKFVDIEPFFLIFHESNQINVDYSMDDITFKNYKIEEIDNYFTILDTNHVYDGLNFSNWIIEMSSVYSDSFEMYHDVSINKNNSQVFRYQFQAAK
ncbi:MAG: hypothetical protein ACRCVT_11595 [Leadbetterella sp.]